MTLRRQSVAPGDDARADEQVDVAVAVEVAAAPRTLPFSAIGGSASGASARCPCAVVEVQPVAQLRSVAPELVAAADDVQVRMPVAVGVEERRVHVLGDAVGGEHGCRRAPGSDRRAAAGTDGPAATSRRRRTGRRARRRRRRRSPSAGPSRREQVRHQRLAIGVEERRSRACTKSTVARGRALGEQRRAPRRRRGAQRPAASCCASVSMLIRRDVRSAPGSAGRATRRSASRRAPCAPSPKCSRRSTDDRKPRVGICSSSCVVPPVLHEHLRADALACSRRRRAARS